MSVLKYAPDISAIELVILDQLQDPGLLIRATAVRFEVKQFEQWKSISNQRFFYWRDKLADRGLIKKSAATSKGINLRISKAGVRERVKAKRFFASLAG